MRLLHRVVLSGVLVGLFAVGGVASASASTIVYASRSVFLANAGAVTNISFDGIAAADSFVAYGAGPAVFSGVTVTGDGSMFVIDPGFYGASYANGGFLNSDYAGATDTLHFVLPSAVTAMGFDFGGLFSGPVMFSVSLSNGDVFSAGTNGSIIAAGALGFVGFTSNVAFSSFDVIMPDQPNYNAIDNLTISSAVPEPASMTLLASGLVGLAARRLRKRQNS